MATKPVDTPADNKLAAVPQPKNALATANFGYAPQTFEQAYKLAEMIARSGLAPADFKGNPDNTFIAMQMGAELGISPMAAIQNIAVINGRPTLWGDSLLAVVMNHPAYEFHEEFIEGDGDGRVAVFRIQRKSHKLHEVRFSVTDAKKAKLWDKPGPWQQYPERMLKMRARGWALRDKFADALRGMITREEAEDYPGGVTITAEPVIPEAERADHDACKKLLEASGQNQANVEMKLSQFRGRYDQLRKNLEANLIRPTNGGTHVVEATGGHVADAVADSSDRGVREVETRGKAQPEGEQDAAVDRGADASGANAGNGNVSEQPAGDAQGTASVKKPAQNGFGF